MKQSIVSMGVLVKLFGVWNKNYKLAYVCAGSIDAALTLAVEKAHLKRTDGFRKWKDLTDNCPADAPDLATGLLARGEIGVVTQPPFSQEWRTI